MIPYLKTKYQFETFHQPAVNYHVFRNHYFKSLNAPTHPFYIHTPLKMCRKTYLVCKLDPTVKRTWHHKCILCYLGLNRHAVISLQEGRIIFERGIRCTLFHFTHFFIIKEFTHCTEIFWSQLFFTCILCPLPIWNGKVESRCRQLFPHFSRYFDNLLKETLSMILSLPFLLPKCQPPLFLLFVQGLDFVPSRENHIWFSRDSFARINWFSFYDKIHNTAESNCYAN